MIDTCNSAASSGNQDACAICFEPLATKRVITLHPCMHRFHHTCIVRWLESAENFVTAEPRCSHCRTIAERRIDEKGRRVPLIFPMEEKHEELDIREVVLTDMVDLWTTISGILDSLNEDKKGAEQIGKSEEYIADIDQEMDKLRNRQDATELVFVTIVINKDELIKSLQAEVEGQKTALSVEFNDGIRTRALARRKHALEKELSNAKKEFKDEVNATAKDAQAAFKKHCAAKLAAAAEVAAKNLAAVAAAAPHGPATTVPAKRRMRVVNSSEEGSQTKRRR